MTYQAAQYCYVQTLRSSLDQYTVTKPHMCVLFEGGARGRRIGRRTLVKTWLKMAIKDVKSSMFVRMMKMSMSC